MALKKGNKVSAEFSMSSLTDIIFLLLIFFMLTSSMIQINMDIPEAYAKTVAPADIIVMVAKDGTIKLNGKVTFMSRLKSEIGALLPKMENRKNATITIVAEKTVNWEKTSELMKIASALNCRAIIGTKPKG